jgi:haloalkane dehalogenase
VTASRSVQNLDWLDRSLYPFASKYLELGDGRIHYVDEGAGSPILMVHGTPTWSFLYRDLIKALSARHRVVAPDHLGFGLSEKPENAAYRPADHARRLTGLIEHLGLEEITLVVHDFGGPIGLAYAIEYPENVTKLILFNTWMWSLNGNWPIERASRLLGGAVGKFLYTRLNFSPRVLIGAAYGDKGKLTPEVHRHYLAPFGPARDRVAPWIFAKELIASGDWYDHLWERRLRIADKPALVLWGMKDPTFQPRDLVRWEQTLTRARMVRLREAGHFVPEEATAEVVSQVQEFLVADVARG